MEHIITVRSRLTSQFHQLNIGKGAKIDLREVRHNRIMVKFICEEHTNNPYCIVGNIDELYCIRTEILKLERIGRMKYRDYLEAKIRGEL